ncbi:MAG TPA: endonuclease III [Candidatus Absconditabacterales bacterium]|nr:endonuclease III [Candidatus Absconditabacterales bacterium]HMT27403.1 endonuclease III [Candidatus Absconditabacterales bacterium]
MTKETIKKIFEMLEKMYPDPKTELHYETPFQLTIAVIMSAQTTDKQVNKVTDKLFQKVSGPADVLKLGLPKLMSAINSVNFFRNKANNIFKLAHVLVDADFQKNILAEKNLDAQKMGKKYGYVLPTTIDGLTELPGIGIKTAKVIGHVLWDLPVIAVDTHVHRVTNRLGIVTTKTPEETSDILEKKVPEEYKTFAHHALILFGRYHCTAQKPKCETCPLSSMCRYFKGLK